MPLPLLLAAPVIWEGIVALVTFCARRAVWAMIVNKTVEYGWDVDLMGEIMTRINKIIVGWTNHLTGLELDPEDPLSDASLAGAISAKAGIKLRSVKDKQIIVEDLAAVAAQAIGEKTGMVLRNPLDKATVIEDVETFATDRLYDRTGLRLRSLRDKAQVREDVTAFAVGQIGNRYGIPITDPSSVDAVVADLKTWGKQQAMAAVADDIAGALDGKGADGVNLATAIIARTKTAARPDGMTKAQIIQAAHVKLADYVRGIDKQVAEGTPAMRRREQNRQAQRRFRQRWKPDSPYFDKDRQGGYMSYVKVGTGEKAGAIKPAPTDASPTSDVSKLPGKGSVLPAPNMSSIKGNQSTADSPRDPNFKFEAPSPTAPTKTPPPAPALPKDLKAKLAAQKAAEQSGTVGATQPAPAQPKGIANAWVKVVPPIARPAKPKGIKK